MTIKDFFIFIRWKNVLMIILIQYLFKYVLFGKLNLMVSLDNLHFALLTFSTVCIAIAGYIINDINDVKADIINKPNRLFIDRKITRLKAQNLFIIINSIGLLLGMYLSYHIRHTSYFIIYVLTSLLLYTYAGSLKKKFLIGNIIVSLVIFLSIILILVFDVIPATNEYNLQSQLLSFKLLVLYATFGFVLTFMREVVKDIEDINGDKAIDARTIPIVIGISKTKIIVILVAILSIVTVLFFSYKLIAFNSSIAIYLLVLVVLPLLYFIFGIARAKTKKQFFYMSALLKLIMLSGILTMLFI